jgi:hypothetical protein
VMTELLERFADEFIEFWFQRKQPQSERFFPSCR